MANTTFRTINFASININAMSSPNKINALITFLRTVNADIVFLQEVYDPNLTLPGFNTVTNVNETNRGTAIALKDHYQFSHVERSLDSRLISVRFENSTTLCNIYAPSGSHRKQEREVFFNRTLANHLRSATQHVLLAGDFNSIIMSKDATGCGNISAALKNVTKSMSMCDSWEALKGNYVEYSFIARGFGSRIDRIYVSSNLKSQLRNTDMHLVAFSDHKAITVRLCLPNVPDQRRNSYWQLRPHILTQENIKEFQCKWNSWTRQRRNFDSWIAWWIRCAKPKIKSFFRWKTSEKFKEFRLQNDALYTQLKAAHERYLTNPDELANINCIKGKILLIQKRFSEDYARINEVRMCGENMTTFQLGQRRKKCTYIDKLTTDDGTNLHDKQDIERYISDYYKILYAAENTGTDESFRATRIIPEGCTINRDCMQEIYFDELNLAIKKSASKKSPGPDGIPIEFYRSTLEIIRRELVLIMNEALNGHVPQQFVSGVIVLVKKKGGGSTLASFRPISLLNTDYKLLARIIKLRLDAIISQWQIISPAQKCSNRPANIFQAILSVKEKIVKHKLERRSGKLISFDLSQAFDRVDRKFLLASMENMGFHPELVKLLKRLGDQSSSQILINGSLSPAFPIQRSVRQGDPLSMHLFVLYLQPLINKIEGICSEPGDLVVAYADDISVVLSSAEKIERVRRIFDAFSICSGAKLNVQKTIALDIGMVTPKNRITVPWLRTVERLRLLGILFSNNIRDAAGQNWDIIIQKFRNLVWLHRVRDLNLVQKVILLNTFLLPKLWFVASVCGSRASDIAKVTSIVGSLLWNGSGGIRVPLQQLALPRDRGGLNLHIPEVKAIALLVNRYVAEQQSLEFGAQHISCVRNPPDITSIPSSYPCLRSVVQRLAYAPSMLTKEPSTKGFSKLIVGRLPGPKILSQASTQIDWKMVWKKIHCKKLSSEQRSGLYLLVNGKISHGELLMKMGRTSSVSCMYCIERDTLEHKFTLCTRVIAAWDLLQQCIRNVVPGFQPSFQCLRFPVFAGITASQSYNVIRLFANYIIHIVGNNDAAIDLTVLKSCLCL
uniref:Reverse transcriptase domain-containing protein n=1 Tax=Anopheles atroparvus TaxID=41427 RepID=A0AAG5DMJ3_ANOAO